MGAMLQKPVMSSLIERVASRQFNVGVAEVNGHRTNMEDAHLIHLRDGFGIFGVFDGHGGVQCSKWIAQRLKQEFERNGCPADDAAIKELFLRVDREFLDTELPSGTTATMCIVRKLAAGKNRLTVVNAGDSRVLLGRRDGSIVDGGGTDQGLTTDHKPNHPVERERIERCGGTVEPAMGGVSRLNGDLAVCRGFGDREYKKQGPDPRDLENQPATASPEIGSFDCNDSDFILLVCDGVSEGDFPNPHVVKFVADKLQERGNAGYVAKDVCQKAVDHNSKDNVTCMIVLLDGDSDASDVKHSTEFVAGPLSLPTDKNFLTAYEEMAKRANLTLATAAEKRYEDLESQIHLPEAKREKDEIDNCIGKPAGEKGSEDRRRWFESWADKRSDSDFSSDRDILAQLAMAREEAGGTGGI